MVLLISKGFQNYLELLLGDAIAFKKTVNQGKCLIKTESKDTNTNIDWSRYYMRGFCIEDKTMSDKFPSWKNATNLYSMLEV